MQPTSEFPPDRSLPIAVFDSGVGGLTVLHEFLVSLPSEDFVYLGDTAFFPYGIKTPDELGRRVELISRMLLDRGTKLLVIACNAATSVAREVAVAEAEKYGVGVLSVIFPEAEIASAITENRRVGVLATPTTVSSGAYKRALEQAGRGLDVVEVAAPDLAPIIQHGNTFDQSVVDTVRSYCEPLQRADVDTLILGCTHYPLVAPMLQRILGRDVRLVTAGHAIAAAAQRLLASRELEASAGVEGHYRFLCTGEVSSFRDLGGRFLQMPLGDIEHVDTLGGS
jgi:glutamate racemase